LAYSTVAKSIQESSPHKLVGGLLIVVDIVIMA